METCNLWYSQTVHYLINATQTWKFSLHSRMFVCVCVVIVVVVMQFDAHNNFRIKFWHVLSTIIIIWHLWNSFYVGNIFLKQNYIKNATKNHEATLWHQTSSMKSHKSRSIWFKRENCNNLTHSIGSPSFNHQKILLPLFTLKLAAFLCSNSNADSLLCCCICVKSKINL